MIRACKKIKINHRAKFRDKDIFCAGFISGSHYFTPYFHFRCFTRDTFVINFMEYATREIILRLLLLLWIVVSDAIKDNNNYLLFLVFRVKCSA